MSQPNLIHNFMTTLAKHFGELVTEVIHNGNRMLSTNRYALDFQVPIVKIDDAVLYAAQIMFLTSNEDDELEIYTLGFSISEELIRSLRDWESSARATAAMLVESIKQSGKIPMLMRPGVMIGCPKNMKRIWVE